MHHLEIGAADLELATACIKQEHEKSQGMSSLHKSLNLNWSLINGSENIPYFDPAGENILPFHIILGIQTWHLVVSGQSDVKKPKMWEKSPRSGPLGTQCASPLFKY